MFKGILRPKASEIGPKVSLEIEIPSTNTETENCTIVTDVPKTSGIFGNEGMYKPEAINSTDAKNIASIKNVLFDSDFTSIRQC